MVGLKAYEKLMGDESAVFTVKPSDGFRFHYKNGGDGERFTGRVRSDCVLESATA